MSLLQKSRIKGTIFCKKDLSFSKVSSILNVLCQGTMTLTKFSKVSPPRNSLDKGTREMTFEKFQEVNVLSWALIQDAYTSQLIYTELDFENEQQVVLPRCDMCVRMNIWIYEYMNIWIYESMNMWAYIHAYMNIRIYEFMNIWVYEYMNMYAYMNI